MAALDKIFELLDEEPDLVDGRTHRAAARCAARSRSTTSSSPTAAEDDRRAVRHRPDRAAGADGGAGRRDRRRQVDAGQARRALLRPDRRARSSSTATTCATSPRVAALADGHRAAGGVPVQRHDRREHRVRPPRRHAGRGRGGRPGGRRARVHRRAARTATTPRSASAAPSSRPGSASSWRSRAPLIADPRILVLDEATSNVDMHTEAQIENGLRRLLGGPHGDRHRPPPVDDPARRPDRGARPRARSSSRARTTSCSRRRAPTVALYRDWAEQAAA